VTRGPSGALLATPQGQPLVVTGTPAAGGDPCGAGDAFAAAAAAALGERATLGEAVEEAVARAGAFVAAGGASRIGSVARDRPRRRDGPAAKPGLLDVAEAAALIDEVRADGGVVVATGGCFDLLHPGHVGLLAEARRLGDLLVVLLNGDSSVARLKGPGRPIQRAVDRATVLAALDAVDAVVVFDDDTPVPVLERLRPDLFAKGGDYAATELPETAALARWGGEVVILPYLSGRSTTRLVEASRAR
jgi:D-beta-D-heptose 7-phosphate kinase/D-beta-D-heptose 1-phosphate adenosyltransferase